MNCATALEDIEMELGRVGIFSLAFLFHPDKGEVAEAAAELEDLGFGALLCPGWLGGDEIFPSYDRLLRATRSASVVGAVVNVWRHTVDEAAAEFASLERAHPGRFQLGLGTSHAPALEPGEYKPPLATMTAYLDGLDAAAEQVPRERRLLAALGPRMLEIAAERAAGSLPYFVPVEHTRLVRERLGPDAIVAVEQSVLLESDPSVAREIARNTRMSSLDMPNYKKNLLRLGFSEDDVRDRGSDRLVDALIAWGDEDDIAKRVAEHHAAGADHVALQIINTADGLPREDWRRLAPPNTVGSRP